MMSDKTNMQNSYLSKKMSKVRWKPEVGSNSETFVTGSWDDEENEIALWAYPVLENDEDLSISPCKVYSLQHEGDVTEIKFVDSNHFLAASTLGNVELLKVDSGQASSAQFKSACRWDKLHFSPTGEESACMGLAIFEDDIATFGEDGRINLLSTRHEERIRVYDDADSCTLFCACFLKHNELLTGNARGQMKIWDLRSGSDKPQATFMLSGDQIGAKCVVPHPTQRHVVLAGGVDGSITVWDLRVNPTPASVISAHAHAVSELQFHPDRPEHVFTCSHSGDLWHWNTTAHNRFSTLKPDDDNPWLSNDAVKSRIKVSELMPQLHLPVNSLDINNNHLICCSDNEAVYIINNLPI